MLMCAAGAKLQRVDWPPSLGFIFMPQSLAGQPRRTSSADVRDMSEADVLDWLDAIGAGACRAAFQT